MTLQIKKYVLGFAFWRDHVALIFKTKGPEYVVGTWNGIGGKIEAIDMDSSEHAMSREFEEETGYSVPPDMWHKFAVQRGKSWDGPDYELNCFFADLPWDDEYFDIKNTEGDGEEVAWFDHFELENYKITPNLKWLIPLALDGTTGFLDIREN